MRIRTHPGDRLPKELTDIALCYHAGSSSGGRGPGGAGLGNLFDKCLKAVARRRCAISCATARRLHGSLRRQRSLPALPRRHRDDGCGQNSSLIEYERLTQRRKGAKKTRK